MSAFNTYRFLVIPAGSPVSVWVDGTDITLPSSTTAQDLLKDGNITINARGAGVHTVTVQNTAGGGLELQVQGSVIATGEVRAQGIGVSNGANTTTLSSAATTARSVQFPDAPGNVPLLETDNVWSGKNTLSARTILGPLTVSNILALPTPTAGITVYASDARAIQGVDILTGNFVVQGAGAGTGALCTYNGSLWQIAGTEVTMGA